MKQPDASPTVDSVMLEQRAAQFTKRSIKTVSKAQGLRLAISMIDLTTLEGKDSPEKVRALCRKAIAPDAPWRAAAKQEAAGMSGAGAAKVELGGIPPVAAVCVYPNLIGVAREALAGTGVKVAAVASGFPSGQYPLDVRLADVRAAVEAGADEIDMVINRGAFLAGRYDEVAREIELVKQACVGDGDGEAAHLKVILETGELETYDNVRRASDLAIQAATSAGATGERGVADGEVFIKTSTGKVAPAATMPVTLVMLEAIRDHYRASGVRIGMKPAGGIRSAKSALHYLVMVNETLGPTWLSPRLFRFGASTLLNDLLRQLIKQTTGQYMASYDFSET